MGIVQKGASGELEIYWSESHLDEKGERKTFGRYHNLSELTSLLSKLGLLVKGCTFCKMPAFETTCLAFPGQVDLCPRCYIEAAYLMELHVSKIEPKDRTEAEMRITECQMIVKAALASKYGKKTSG